MDKKYFIEISGRQIPVSKEVYYAFKRLAWKERKRRQVREEKELSLEAFADAGFEIPSGQALVDEIIEDKLLLDMLSKALSPYRHQISAFNFVCGKFGLISASGMPSSGAALLMEMGIGKSLTSIAVAGALYQAGKIHRVLVVAPLSILGVWDEEFLKRPRSGCARLQNNQFRRFSKCQAKKKRH